MRYLSGLLLGAALVMAITTKEHPHPVTYALIGAGLLVGGIDLLTRRKDN